MRAAEHQRVHFRQGPHVALHREPCDLRILPTLFDDRREQRRRNLGTRLLKRILPIPRPWRLLLTILLGFGFLGWVFYFAGTTIAAQFETLRIVVTAQFHRLMEFAASLGLLSRSQAGPLGTQLLGSVGRLTSAVGSAIGAITRRRTHRGGG